MRKHVNLFIILILALVTAAAASAQTPPYTRTIIVNNTGSPTTDGAALLSALSGLSPAPNYLNRWIIQLEGGVYDIGTTPLVLQPYVDLVGAGSNTSAVRGSVAPIGVLGGLVKGASHSEIRALTIQCLSNSTVTSCQALELNAANARLVDMVIYSGGSGTGSHWGVRTFDSSPTFDRVDINVPGSGGYDNYGIVYGGSSQLNITRSNIDVRNAPNNNWGILFEDYPLYSTIRDSVIRVKGGDEAAGIRYNDIQTAASLTADNVEIVANGATNSYGILGLTNGGFPTINYRTGSVYGATHGISHQGATLNLVNTDIHGSTVRVIGYDVKIGGSWLRGGGTILGGLLVCAGTFDDSFTFYPNTCPP